MSYDVASGIRRRAWWGTLGLIAALGCSGGQDSAEKAAGPDKEGARSVASGTTAGGVAPSQSDTLLLAYQNDPNTINAIIANDNVSNAFLAYVYEPLAEQDFADPDKWKPALATDWEFDPEKLEFTIHLRKGVKWHPMALPDGKMLPETEFTARDVKFTFDCILNEGVDAAHLRSYYENPEAKDRSEKYKIRVDVVDKYTVKIKWSEPYFLAQEFTLSVAIIPRHVYSVDEKGEPISFDFSSAEFAKGFNNHWANNKMCGTGPMIFSDWRSNQSVRFERNPNYWGTPYFFKEVLYRCIPNNNTVLQMLLQNELDWSGIAQKDLYLQTKTDPRVEKGNLKLVDYFYPGYRYIGYNQQRAFLADKNVRTALGHTIPLDTVIREVWKGLAEPVQGPFLPGSSAENPNIKPLAFDLNRARELLDQAGWKDSDSDGIRDKMVDGVKIPARFELIIFSEAPDYRRLAEIYQENCRQIGVDVAISPTKWALMLEKLNKKDFDAAMLGWGMSWKQDPFQLWHSSQADVPESSNAIGYRNPEVDRLIEKLRVTMEPEKQQELYHQIHALIFADQPYTFLFADRATAGHDPRIENIQFYKIRPCVDNREWYSKTPRGKAAGPTAQAGR